MKTRRCFIAQPGQRSRPVIATADIVTCRDSFRARYTLEAFKNRFGGAASQAGISKLFRNLDFDNDGYITSADLLTLARSRGMVVGEQDCHAVMTKLDPKKIGSVDITEFMRYMSKGGGCFLDQLQRSIVGVDRGGTVYKKHYDTSRTSSSTQRTLSSVRGICEAVNSGIDKFRASTGRLDCFYHGLSVPHRNLPWDEDNRYTVQPIPIASNPQCLSDRFRFDRRSNSMSDRHHRNAHTEFRNTRYREEGRAVLVRAKETEVRLFEQDLNRVAAKTIAITDYHHRVGRPMYYSFLC